MLLDIEYLTALPVQEVCFNGFCLYNRSSVSDSGISMICNVFSETLTRLLLALCPNVTSSNHCFILNWFTNFNLVYFYFN